MTFVTVRLKSHQGVNLTNDAAMTKRRILYDKNKTVKNNTLAKDFLTVSTILEQALSCASFLLLCFSKVRKVWESVNCLL